MAKRKIDEQISYNWLFFLLAGGFAAVTFWAVYDETVTRREYKKYQEAFFDVEVSIAKTRMEGEKKKLDENARYQALEAEKQAIEKELTSPEARAHVAAAEKKLQEATIAAFDKTQDYTFTKSELDEAYYYYTLAKHDHPDRQAEEYTTAEKRYLDLRQREAEAMKVKVEYDDKKKAADAEVKKLKKADRVAEINKEMEAIRRPYDEAIRAHAVAEKKVKGSLLAGKATEVIQQNLEEIGKVDRCQSCHLGAARGGFEAAPRGPVPDKVFQSHPMRRTLLAIHPPEKFGCTTCHDGQGRATTKFYAHAPGPEEDAHAFHEHYWETPLLKGPPGGNGKEYMQAKCRSCHRSEWDLRSELICDSDAECPDTNAAGKPIICDVPNPPGDPQAPRGSLEEAMRVSTAPAAEPQKFCLESTVQVKDLTNAQERSRFIKRAVPAYVDLAPVLSKGLKVIEESGCYGCHPIEGYLAKPKPAPDLTRIAHKVKTSWMIEWIKDPRAFRPNTRMPRFWPEIDDPLAYPYPVNVEDAKKQRDAEALAMTAFLVHSSRESAKYRYALDPIPADVAAAADVKRGEELVGTLGCAACHNVPVASAKVDHKNRATHFDHGPDLTNIGAKTTKEWIYNWVLDPKRFSPGTRMPNLRMSKQEAADVAAFLEAQTGGKSYGALDADLDDANLVNYGKTLIKNYGCFGCHLVEGFEETPGIGAELSEFGIKTTDRLDYGDLITDHNLATWDAWLSNKLQHPRVYAYDLLPWQQGKIRDGKAVMRMPEFSLNDDERRAVMVVLKGMRGTDDLDTNVLQHELTTAQVARERGRELVRWYNCYGCHRLDGHEGDLGQLEQYSIKKGNGKYGPPILTGEGQKTQPDWLFAFIKRPYLLRPLPKIRMPSFGLTDQEATDVVAMFSALDRAEFPFRFYADVSPADADELAVGEALFKASNCQQCHLVGDVTPGAALPEAVVAPNLVMAKDRLRAEWVNRWLADPGRLQEATAMPPFWTGKNALEQAVANTPEGQRLKAQLGDERLKPYLDSRERQIQAVRNYLFILRPPGAAPAPTPTAPQTAQVPSATGVR